jgi:hypothetical protein
MIFKKNFMPVGLLSLVSLCAVALGAAAKESDSNVPAAMPVNTSTPNLMKQIFPIGVWYDGRVEGINCPKGYVNVPSGIENAKAYYEKTFKDIKAHGIDIIVIPNTPPQYRQTLLSVADEVGVKIVLELVELAFVDFGGDLSVRSPNMVKDANILRQRIADLIKPLQDHKSLLCYQIIDEPSVELADNFQRAAETLKELDPAHPAFSCLCREKELARTSAMGTPMLIFDRYPIKERSTSGDYDFQSYIGILEQLNHYGGINDIPCWMVVQAFAQPTAYRLPTDAELRVLTYLPLSRNCKGVFFFIYNSMTQTEKLQGLVDVQLVPRQLWSTVGKVAGELRQLAPVLLDIKPAAAFAFSDDKKVDIQSFENSKKQKYIFVTNLDVIKATTAAIRLKIDSKPNQIRNLLTDTPIKTGDLQGDSLSIEVNLEAGECAILQI